MYYKPFVFELPPEKIAQRPVKPYDSARLLIAGEKLSETVFSDLAHYLSADDVLVFNNTEVKKCRLFGRIAAGRAEETEEEKTPGKKGAELLITARLSENRFRAIARPIKHLPVGARIVFDLNLRAEVVERLSERELCVEFLSADGFSEEALQRAACMPIPPYIRKGRGDQADEVDYQTIFAERSGSIAAPTASLHFTRELLERIKEKGVKVELLTLHLGAASFRTLWEGDNINELKPPGKESYLPDSKLIKRLRSFKSEGRRIIAIGTSVVRGLESMALYAGSEGVCETDLFISPGFKFEIVDALITNFHFPASSHLLLVQALMGEERLKAAYEYALANGFRFLSYGDGMFIR